MIVRLSETFFEQTDNRRCPKDEIRTECPENIFSNHYRDLKVFYQKGIGEAVSKRFVDSTGVETKNIYQFRDLGFPSLILQSINFLKKLKKIHLGFDLLQHISNLENLS